MKRAGIGALFLCLICAAASRAQDLVFEPAPASSGASRAVLLDVARAGDRLVAVGSAGLVSLSDDGGASWRQASVPVSATLTAVHFPTSTDGWAVGHAGVILHSADAGETWALQFDGRRANEALVAYAASQRATLEAELALLEADDSASEEARGDLEYALEDAIFLEEDAQVAVETGPADPLLTVRFLDAERGFAAGAYGAFLRTVDGGVTWELALAGLDNPDRFHFYSVLPANDGALYLAGEAGLLYRSTDQGLTFERYWDVYEGSLFGLVEGGEGVVAFGLRGNLFRYVAALDVWEPLASENEASLYGGTRRADGTTIFVGAGGRVVTRTGEGAEAITSHPSRSTLSSALVTAQEKLLLVGMDGLLEQQGAPGS